MNKRQRKKQAKKAGLTFLPKGWIWENGILIETRNNVVVR